MTDKTTAQIVLHLNGLSKGGAVLIDAEIDALVIAGWTGRDPAAMEAHIVELEALGIARPKTTPIFYRGAAALLTTGSVIEVVGIDSSGEVEPVIVSLANGLWLGVGSDHTDRKVEAIGVTISKQLCAKPIGPALWRYDEVEGHWDDLVIRSFATTNRQRRLYQEGPLKKMRHPADLMGRYLGAGTVLPPGTAMFCGTLAVRGKIAAADSYDLEIEDPVLDRKITHRYAVRALPIEG